MKTVILVGLLAIFWMGVAPLQGQDTNAVPASDADNTNAPAADADTVATPAADTDGAASVAPAPDTGGAAPAVRPVPPPSRRPGGRTARAAVEAPAAEPVTAEPAVDAPTAILDAGGKNGTGENGLRFNFRGVPLETVLNYLSEAAGFIIVMETKVEGKVDAWSRQPLTKDEAVDLLNKVLNKNGYAAIRNERTLTIVSRDEAKKRDLPVKKGSDPALIPKNDAMVTQILPVRYANAVQMTKDLTPLLPTFANMTANESGNALVITATQSDVRRMAEIIKALDTSISGISAVKVFLLKFADAKDLAAVIKELFPAPNTSNSSGGGRNNFNNPLAMFGRGGGAAGGGGGGGASTAGQSEARAAASKVTAVADERTNALIVSAPDEIIALIEDLVREIDTNAENITEVHVFHLKSADPVEMADLLTSLFPDETNSSSTSGRSTVQFGGGRMGGGFFGGGANTTSQTGTSTRSKQKGKVVAVADQRTASLVVSAARDLMPSIEAMIEQLDSNPAKKQKVVVYSLDNADVDEVTTVLQDMFQSTTSNNRSSSRNSTQNALTTRQTQNNQSMNQNSSSSRTSSSRSSSSLP